MNVKFKILRADPLSTRESLCEEAAKFASSVGHERLISMSQSEDKDVGVVTIWYWDKTPSPMRRMDKLEYEGVDESLYDSPGENPF